MAAEDPKSLGQRIAEAQAVRDANEAAKKPAATDATKSAGMALRYSAEFVAAVVVGAGLGYMVDRFFKTAPFGLLIFMAFGIAAAFRNVLRAARKLNEEGQKAADSAAASASKTSETTDE